jgi:hypothetical protein
VALAHRCELALERQPVDEVVARLQAFVAHEALARAHRECFLETLRIEVGRGNRAHLAALTRRSKAASVSGSGVVASSLCA